MHGIQGTHPQRSETKAAHVVGHGGHTTPRLEGVHVGVRTEGLREWRRVCHDWVYSKPETEQMKIFLQ